MNKLAILSVLALVGSISGFSTPRSTLVVGYGVRSSKLFKVLDEGGDFPPEENSDDYTGSVDWDAEWKKVVSSDGGLPGGMERPGKDFYKSEAEIAAIKASNSASEKAVSAGVKISDSIPDIRSLAGDWKVSSDLIFEYCGFFKTSLGLTTSTYVTCMLYVVLDCYPCHHQCWYLSSVGSPRHASS
jgi:hypothetical protein